MKRRDFLVGSVSALAAGAAARPAFSEIIVPTEATPAEMSRFLNELDGAMHLIAQDPGGGRFINQLLPRPPAVEDITLFRQGMRSLLLVGNFGDLPLSGKVHPGVQSRLRYSAPEMDAAVLTLTEKMRAMTPAKRAAIKRALNDDPMIADRVIEAVDLEAASIGVPGRRRLQLRAIGKHVVRRLRQSSDMLIDEYVIKCEKLAARPPDPLESQSMMAMRMGEAAFKKRLQDAEDAARRWQNIGTDATPIGYALIQQKPEDDEESDRWYRTGLRILGVGAGMTALGWLLIGLSGDNAEGPTAGPGVVLGVTIGPILIAVGLVTLIIGGIIDIDDGPGKTETGGEATSGEEQSGGSSNSQDGGSSNRQDDGSSNRKDDGSSNGQDDGSSNGQDQSNRP